eukprot:4652953-Alexandrium_andersonii.AAC.1
MACPKCSMVALASTQRTVGGQGARYRTLTYLPAQRAALIRTWLVLVVSHNIWRWRSPTVTTRTHQTHHYAAGAGNAPPLRAHER